jgi:hypothetical protein
MPPLERAPPGASYPAGEFRKMCDCPMSDKVFMVDITDGFAEVVGVCNNPDHWEANRQYCRIDGGRCTADRDKAQEVADGYNLLDSDEIS